MKGLKGITVIPVIVALLAMLVLPALPAQASDEVVSIPDATVGSGGIVTLPINITNVTNLGTATIWLSYNKNVVTVDSVADGDMGTVTYAIYNDEGVTKMTWYAAHGKTGDHVFAYVTLHAATTSTDLTSSLDLEVKEFVDTSFTPIIPAVTDGTFNIDATKPTVTSVTPATLSDNEAGAAVDVTIVFSETMDGTDPTVTITGLATTPYTVTSGTWTDDTWTGSFTFNDDGEEATGTYSISGAKDAVGNEMLVDNTNTVDVDTKNPAVTVVTPLDNATAVLTTASVSATFHESISQGGTFAGIVITPDPTGVSGSIADSTLTIAHGDFDYLTTYTVTIPAAAVEDASGNTNIEYTWSFTPCMEGDVTTTDNYVSSADALFIARYVVGLEILDANQLISGDTTDDGSVTGADAMHIAQWVVDPTGGGGVLKVALWIDAKDAAYTVPPEAP